MESTITLKDQCLEYLSYAYMNIVDIIDKHCYINENALLEMYRSMNSVALLFIEFDEIRELDSPNFIDMNKSTIINYMMEYKNISFLEACYLFERLPNELRNIKELSNGGTIHSYINYIIEEDNSISRSIKKNLILINDSIFERLY